MSHLKIHAADIKVIIETVSEYAHVTVTAEEACKMWETFSKTKAAGWVYLPNDYADIWKCLSTIDLTEYIGWTSADILYK